MTTQFKNMPTLKDEDGEQKIKRYSHSALEIEHNGIQAKIQTNGRTILQKIAKVSGEEIEYDEIEVPASLIFKLAYLLKTTRHVQYVPIGGPSVDKE